MGGVGQATLNGGTGYDILCGCYTSNEDIYAQMEAGLSIWETVTSTTLYDTVVAELSSAAAGELYCNAGDVLNAGTHQLDWYSADMASEITGEHGGEIVTLG